MACNQNSPGGDAAEKLSRIPRYHEFKNSPKEDPKKTARRPKSSKRSKSPRDPCCLNCPKVQVAKRSKMSKVQGFP